MNKNKALKIVNVLLAVDFTIIAVTAILHELIIPSGLYDLVHALPGFLFIILVIVHLVLNKTWVRKNYFTKHTDKSQPVSPDQQSQ